MTDVLFVVAVIVTVSVNLVDCVILREYQLMHQ